MAENSEFRYAQWHRLDLKPGHGCRQHVPRRQEITIARISPQCIPILFHTLMRTRSVAEVNLSQATGSVGEGMAAGVIFVFPALVLSGAVKPFAAWGVTEYASVTLAVLAGSVLGVVLTGFLPAWC
jgi:uncharacterized oligopeptide transporter (OPT) family protein